MNVLLGCIDVHHVHARCPWRSVEGVRSAGNRVIDSCERQMNPDVSAKSRSSYLLPTSALTTEPSPAPIKNIFEGESCEIIILF